MSQCVHPYAVNHVRAWVSAPHAQMDTVSPASTDSLTGCVGLAANGAGPRRCTAGVTPASVRTASSGRPSDRGGDGTPRRVPGSDQPQSSCTLTPILHRRDYTKVPTTRCTGREWTSESPPLQLGRPPPRKETDDSRKATAPRDVAWAAAGVLEPQGTSFGTVALWDPSRCQCLSVVRS